MPRTFARLALLLVVSLALLSPGNVVAGPPEKIPGKLVFDEVADGLLRYRAEEDEQKRMKWLVRLAPTRDPRVAVVLGELVTAWKPNRNPEVMEEGELAFICLIKFEYDTSFSHSTNYYKSVLGWWKTNEVELRRRAKRLSQ